MARDSIARGEGERGGSQSLGTSQKIIYWPIRFQEEILIVEELTEREGRERRREEKG